MHDLLRSQAGTVFFVAATAATGTLFESMDVGIAYLDPGQPQVVSVSNPEGTATFKVVLPDRFQGLSTQVVALSQSFSIIAHTDD